MLESSHSLIQNSYWEALYKILYTGLKNSSTTILMKHMALIVCNYYVKQNIIDYMCSFQVIGCISVVKGRNIQCLQIII